MAVEKSNKDSWKFNVKVASTANVTLRQSNLTVFPIIDGVQIQNGDRVLLKNQNDAKTNGIYTMGRGVLSLDYDSIGNLSFDSGAIVRVTDGSANALTEWYLPPINSEDYFTSNKIWVPSPFQSQPELVFAANLTTIEALDGDVNKIYIAENDGRAYRWNGVAYIEISQGNIVTSESIKLSITNGGNTVTSDPLSGISIVQISDDLFNNPRYKITVPTAKRLFFANFLSYITGAPSQMSFGSDNGTKAFCNSKVTPDSTYDNNINSIVVYQPAL